MFRVRTAIYIIVLLGLLLFLPSLNNQFSIIDDEDQILNHSLVHSITNIPNFFTGSTYYREESATSYGLFYRPLMLTVYSLIYAFDGPRPLFFHLTQLMFHIGNSILIFLLFKHFMKIYWAFFAGLIFLVHPINSDTVLHIANLQETLFLFFGLSALLLSNYKDFNIRRKILLGTLLLLTLFSKEIGIIFIIITLIYAYLFNKKNLSKLALISTASVLIYLIFRFGIANIPLGQNSTALIENVSLLTRIQTIPKIIFTYILTFIFPWKITLAAGWVVNSLTLNDFFLPLFLVTGFFVLLFYGYGRCKTKSKKIYFFFLTWFILGLLPHSQIIPLDATLALRWLYFPIIGLIGIIFLTLNEYLKLPSKKSIAIIAVVVILLFVKTFTRTFDWVDSKTLLSRDLSKNPGNSYLENTLGTILIREKNFQAAKPLIQASVKNYAHFGNLSNLALIYVHEDDYKNADIYFKKAIAAKGNYTTYENYVNFLFYMQKDHQSARDFAIKSLSLYQHSANLWLVLAQAEYSLGNKEEALRAAETALKLNTSEFNEHVYKSIKEGKKINAEKYIKLD